MGAQTNEVVFPAGAKAGQGLEGPTRVSNGHGLGRSERQRIFWERVASGAPPTRRHRVRESLFREKLFREKLSREKRLREQYARENPLGENPTPRRRLRMRFWKRIEPSAITFLAVIAFGLGWVGIEASRVGPAVLGPAVLGPDGLAGNFVHARGVQRTSAESLLTLLETRAASPLLDPIDDR